MNAQTKEEGRENQMPSNRDITLKRGRINGRNAVHKVFFAGMDGPLHTLCGLTGGTLHQIAAAVPITCKNCIKAMDVYIIANAKRRKEGRGERR